ncbi:hypothetical protein LOK49_LG04G03177 [Camellia lanceoleosa]|uniref:Uncharacterized protein n=1 Tax=Camellia lanceoleosa TaxID=1840588 RepID=A0ACC0HY86_9ERIC|nr:hypothetical protein LOK49_LG04G03177 [Camellia lanceoleosa]
MSRLYEMVKEGIEEHPLIHRPFAMFHMTCHSKDQIRGGWDSKCRMITQYDILRIANQSHICQLLFLPPSSLPEDCQVWTNN